MYFTHKIAIDYGSYKLRGEMSSCFIGKICSNLIYFYVELTNARIFKYSRCTNFFNRDICLSEILIVFEKNVHFLVNLYLIKILKFIKNLPLL